MDDLREKVGKKLAANPGLKTGMLADALRVSEADVLRAMPEGYARELEIASLEEFVSGLETLGLVYFVTRNAGCVTEIKGRFGGFSKSGPFFNVNGEGLHLHLRLDRIAAVFHVTPPAREGAPAWPSLQFFVENGEMAFKVFLIESMVAEAGGDFAESLAALEELVGGVGVRNAS